MQLKNTCITLFRIMEYPARQEKRDMVENNFLKHILDQGNYVKPTSGQWAWG